MVAEHLTIRNVTSRPIVLKEVQRFHEPEASKPDLTSLTKSISSLMSNHTRAPEHVAIDHDSKSFAKLDKSVRVEPFKEVKSDVKAFDKSDKERMLLTFEVEGEKYQIQTPVPTNEAASMKALGKDHRFSMTGIFVHSESHLAIFPTVNLNAWMREVKDDTLTSALSIPGTHNSPTCHIAPPSVRCQAVSPREQLDHGVRFFDIRLHPQTPDDPKKEELVLVHSAFPIALSGQKYFRELVKEIESFLEKNPSETLIISLKREGPGTHTDAQLARVLKDHYVEKSKNRWYTEPKIPTVGEARGKIVLVRRFNLDDGLKKEWNGHGWGIDATGWADNTAHATCPSGHLCIQDFYEVMETENIDKKIKYVNEQIARAAEACYPPGKLKAEGGKGQYPYFINFLSASNFWKVGTWPEKVAAKLNPSTVEYICRRVKSEKGDWSTGILVCDWVGLEGDWDLVRSIVGMNTKLMTKQH